MRPSVSGPPTPSHQLDYSGALVPRPEGEATSFAWTRVTRAVLVGTWALVALLHLVLSPERRSLAWTVGYLLLEIIASASLGCRAWVTRGQGRLAWWLLAASALLDVVSILLWIPATLGHSYAWVPGLTKLLSLATGILVLAGVLSFPKGKAQEGAKERGLVDDLGGFWTACCSLRRCCSSSGSWGPTGPRIRAWVCGSWWLTSMQPCWEVA